MVDGTKNHGPAALRGPIGRSGNTAIGLSALVAISLVVVLSLAVASAASGQPQRSSQQPQWILFTATSPTGTEQIYRIKPAGSGLEQLTRGAYPSAAPALSPDGKRIAFSRLGAGILTMNPDGTGVRRLTANSRDRLPAWSPDGKQIAFLRAAPNGWRVYIMSASGAGQRILPQAPPSGRPSWTSRGLLTPTEGDLARISPQTGRVFQMYGATIDALVGGDQTSVSPDLSTITFVGAAPQDPGDKECGEGIPCPRFALYIEDLRKHKAPRLLVRDAGPATFSADGKSLVFVARNRIVIWRLANGTSKVIKAGHVNPTVATPPAW